MNASDEVRSTARAAIYARSAVAGNRDVENQIKACRAAAAEDRMSVSDGDVFVDDGASGRGIPSDRSGMGGLLAEALKVPRTFDLVYIDSLSRFSRNVCDCVKLCEYLNEKGITVRVLDGGTDPSREMNLENWSEILQLSVLDRAL